MTDEELMEKYHCPRCEEFHGDSGLCPQCKRDDGTTFFFYSIGFAFLLYLFVNTFS